MKTKTKVTLPVIHTAEQAETLVNQYAQLKANMAALQAEIDRQRLEIEDRYTPGIALLKDQAETAVKVLLAWSQAHPEAFPKDRKSIQFQSGTIGFRTSNPKLELLNRKWNWNLVLNRIGELGLAAFIRTKEEVDKEAILARHAAGHHGP